MKWRREGGIALSGLFTLIWAFTGFAEENMPSRTSVFNEQWLNAVVSIEIPGEKGGSKPVGTGFVVLTEDLHRVLVTAAHVVRDKKTGRLRSGLYYRRAGIEGSGAIVTDEQLVASGGGSWFFSDTHDLACRFVGWSTQHGSPPAIPVKSILQSSYLQAGAPLLVLGFPLGLRSDPHQRPVARRGMVARADEDGILIETLAYPGNSGGPVVYVPTMKLGAGFSSPLVNEEALVGVVSEYIPYQEVAVSLQTGRPRVVFEENSGLSPIIPAEAIEALLRREDVREQEGKLPKAAAEAPIPDPTHQTQ